MIPTLAPLRPGDHGDCTGCDTVIKAATARQEKPPRRGQSMWALTLGPAKIYWVCLGCACRAAHAHGIVCTMNPTGAKTIPLTIPPVPKEPTNAQA